MTRKQRQFRATSLTPQLKHHLKTFTAAQIFEELSKIRGSSEVKTCISILLNVELCCCCLVTS
ncbi:CLUMA_CG009498, isoform A [Clunio marinus]|uniref:CLUMA_CG009498, isoform A n=1 Tax=Clunio marinus TaxID=568069 RepID=A0A1J1I707_9DIPT|nr:CLUMA_CG009498, isoform A [Clunio marinus]